MNVSGTLEIPGNDSYNASNGLACSGELLQYGIWERVLIVIVAVFLSVTTVVGNIMVMISFKIDKQLQTISNYFLCSLAVADFAIGLISMPLFTVYTVLGYWPLGPHVCDTWLALDYLASNASVLNLLIISFDRYFSVTRPLTYRAKRTTSRAATMIGCAWGISLLLWPPWIYAWPYIEGTRTVPTTECYIQFIETNHYITFGTAIAAFYVPVSVMIILYWRIWKETEKRQKDLSNLQEGKQDPSKRSNSRFDDEALDMDECRRHRSESSTGAEEISTHFAVSYIDKHYPQYKAHRPLSWTWLKMWCVAWWHSGREDDEDDEDIDGPESSRTLYGGDEDVATPISVETPLTTTGSRCPSLGVIRCTTSFTVDKTTSTADQSSAKAVASDSVYTILIKLPPRGSNGAGKAGVEAPSIQMYHEDTVAYHLRSTLEEDDVTAGGDETMAGGGGGGGRVFRHVGTLAGPSSVIRRPSQMPDVRIPLNAKSIPRGPGEAVGKPVAGKPVNKKKKKKIQEKKADRKAAKTLSAILLAFIITWTPYNILVLLKSITACSWQIPQRLWNFFYYLCYINSTVNPVCYALGNEAFRRTYVRILKCKWHSRNRPAVDRGYQ